MEESPTQAQAQTHPSSAELQPLQTPFELFVLEELLREMCDVYDRRMILYRPLVASLLKEVESASDAIEGVHKLVPLSDALYEFEILIRNAQQTLLDVLEEVRSSGDVTVLRFVALCYPNPKKQW